MATLEPSGILASANLLTCNRSAISFKPPNKSENCVKVTWGGGSGDGERKGQAYQGQLQGHSIRTMSEFQELESNRSFESWLCHPLGRIKLVQILPGGK